MSELESWSLPLVGGTGDVEVHSLLPSGRDGSDLPIVLWLHGAASSADSLDRHADLIGERWHAGAMPPAVFTCASTPTSGAFYTDTDSGPWETIISRDLPTATRDRYGANVERVALVGASMGGYGALKLLFETPGDYLGAVAISPAVFPGDAPDEVSPEHRLSVLGELFDLVHDNPVQRVSERLHRNAAAMRGHAPRLFLAVGDVDEFLLADGAEHLHRLLLEEGVHHHYLRWYGATHAGPTTEPMVAAALDFLGTILEPAELTPHDQERRGGLSL